ncbi:hypothetical protein J4461_03135 [Candidatus Pacearchaeota archaeon]|nr:hypothetical protein [Candidatus Pacearchaeota archaeon]
MKRISLVVCAFSLLFLSIGFVIGYSGSDSSNSGNSGNAGVSAGISSGSGDSSSGNSVSTETEIKTSNSGNGNVEANINSGTSASDDDSNKGSSDSSRREERNAEKREREEIRDERGQKIAEFRQRIRMYDGRIRVEERNIIIRELNEEQKEIIAGKINVRTNLNLTAEDINSTTMLRAYLSNGRHAYVKVMPDRASEVALQRLRAKCLERNCTIELREVGTGNKSRLAYTMMTNKDSRLLLIFKKRMEVRAEVDAETGEIITANKPWWAFLAREDNANAAEIEQDVGISANASIDVDVGIKQTNNATVKS